MMILFMLVLSIVCVVLIVLSIVHTIRLNKIKKREKLRHTPKLSELHGKEFGKYMDYLTKDL